MAIFSFTFKRQHRWSGILLACTATAATAQGSGLDVLTPALPIRVETAAPLRAPVSLDASECPVSADTADSGHSDETPVDAPCAANFVAPYDDSAQGDYDFTLGQVAAGIDGPVTIMSGLPRSPPLWFSPLKSLGGGEFDGARYVYRNSDGPNLALGNVATRVPAWASSADIGGIQVSNWSGNEQTLPEGRFGYSSSFGRLNHMNSAQSSSALDYGVAAGSGSVRYGLTPELTVETQMQTAPSLTAHGMGATYATRSFGTFQAGATQSSFDAVNAWRYRFGYQVELADSVSLGVDNEQVGSGFGDLSAYKNGVNQVNRSRNTLSVGVPITGMGTLTGSYSGLRENSTVSERRLGLKHSMFIAPDVNFSVGGNRDIVTGDYEMRANFSLLVQTFFRGGWGN